MQFAQLKRRDFIRLVGGAAAWPLAARGQQQVVHPLIGVLSPLSAASAARNIAGFRSGLRDLGYLEGRSVTLALRYADGAPERMVPLAQELVGLKPDVLMAGSMSGVLAAKAATQTIPTVIITAAEDRRSIADEQRLNTRTSDRGGRDIELSHIADVELL